MCYENERLEWLRREMEKVEELEKQNTAPTPAKPAAPDKEQRRDTAHGHVQRATNRGGIVLGGFLLAAQDKVTVPSGGIWMTAEG